MTVRISPALYVFDAGNVIVAAAFVRNSHAWDTGAISCPPARVLIAGSASRST